MLCLYEAIELATSVIGDDLSVEWYVVEGDMFYFSLERKVEGGRRIGGDKCPRVVVSRGGEVRQVLPHEEEWRDIDGRLRGSWIPRSGFWREDLSDEERANRHVFEFSPQQYYDEAPPAERARMDRRRELLRSLDSDPAVARRMFKEMHARGEIDI